jgi:pimeloyl-ACP methyl ester carboxylesterase
MSTAPEDGPVGREAPEPELAPVPEGRFVDLDGPVHYVEWPGPAETTFVLVHGLGGSHLNWMRVAPRLAARGRVVVPDLPGFGRSPLEGRPAAMHVGRRLLGGFVRSVRSGRTIVGGNSMGGGYAMLLAAFEPDLVDGLLLTSSVFPWAPGGWPSPIVVGGFALYRTPVLGDRAVRERFRRLDPERVVRWGFRITAADPSAIPEEVVEAHVALLRERQNQVGAAVAFVEAARSILALGARPRLTARAMDAIRCPVLVVHGTRDRLVPIAYARSAVRRHPAWRYRFLPRVGHVPQLEAPDRWLDAAEGWLDGLEEPQTPAALQSSASDASSASASASRSGTASRSAVRPKAIVPASEVQAIDSAEVGPSGMEG